jgi:transcriptional regulator with XRE-family HTH domain
MRKPRDEVILNALASEIKSRRNGLGISQDELAFRADLSRTFVGKIELAQSQPALNALFHLASALETDPVDFMNSIWERVQKERGQLSSATSIEG